MTVPDTIIRCGWAGSDPVYVAYHDNEWGVPLHDDRALFEFLILEGAQAGLSWITILKRREGYRRAFEGFDPAPVALFDQSRQTELLADSGIIRNRLKVAAAVDNARAFLDVQAEFGSFDSYIWRFVDGKPLQNRWNSLAEVPASTPLSDSVSRDLKKRGFRFVGSTICYAFMQAVGMVNDHTLDCYRHRQLAGANNSG
ncbi:MAG TPA: DNA-3-methyladenine glycosylase I [Desulfuromonadales bacterium]|nr:DNA-3-methyladenine glycosylase I [Desulfuromonadales bacterium]